MTTTDPVEKESARVRKEERKNYAELEKQEAQAHSEAARRLGESGAPHPGYKTLGDQGRDYTTTAATGEYYPGTEDYTTTGTGDYTTTTRPGDHPGAGDPRHPMGPYR